MVALVAGLLLFAPASAAVALSAGSAAPTTPRTDTSSSPTPGRHVDVGELDSVDPNVTGDSGVVYHFSAGEGMLRPKGEKPGGGGPGKESPGQGKPGEQSPSTTTTLPPTTPPNPPSTSTTSLPPSTTTAPTSTAISAVSSDDDSAAKTTGSISKAPVETLAGPAPAPPSDQSTARPDDEPSPSATTPSRGSGEPEPVEPTAAAPATRERVALDWISLAGEVVSQSAQADPVEALVSEPDASTVVLSWLVERTSTGTSMAVLSPLVVLMTIWDAAASAGSGLAAPASGLGTFVLLLLFEKGHLSNGSRLLRRRNEA